MHASRAPGYLLNNGLSSPGRAVSKARCKSKLEARNQKQFRLPRSACVFEKRRPAIESATTLQIGPEESDKQSSVIRFFDTFCFIFFFSPVVGPDVSSVVAIWSTKVVAAALDELALISAALVTLVLKQMCWLWIAAINCARVITPPCAN